MKSADQTAILKHLTAQMVLNQREKPTLDTTPVPGVLDYAVGGSAMDLAMSALDEAIPNGQRLRVQFAAALISEGWVIQLAWLRAKGYNVDNLVTSRPFTKPTEYEAGIFAEALEGCFTQVIEDTSCWHCGSETKPTAGLEWNTQALADLMTTCVEAHQASEPSQVVVHFDQLGSAGPFPVVDGEVRVPNITMMDLARWLQPTIDALPNRWTTEDGRKTVIELTPAEVQSGHDRVKWAEGLIRQLPVTHEGRNSWLMNYGDQDAMGETLTTLQPEAPEAGVVDARYTGNRSLEDLVSAAADDAAMEGTLNDVSEWNTDKPWPAAPMRAARNQMLNNEYGPYPGHCGVSKTPIGWSCARAKGHEGPCAAVVIAYDPRSELEDTARLQWIVGKLSPDQLASIGMFPFADEKDLEHLREVTDSARRDQAATLAYNHGELEVQQDSASADRFAAAIKQRMFEKTKMGYKGWREADAFDLVQHYHRHSVGGNVLDAAAYLMMVWEKDLENLPLLSPSAMRYRFEDDLLNLTMSAQTQLDDGDGRARWVSAMERCRTTFNIGILTSCELKRRTRGWWGRLMSKLAGE